MTRFEYANCFCRIINVYKQLLFFQDLNNSKLSWWHTRPTVLVTILYMYLYLLNRQKKNHLNCPKRYSIVYLRTKNYKHYSYVTVATIVVCRLPT
jgi:hypothetical protein